MSDCQYCRIYAVLLPATGAVHVLCSTNKVSVIYKKIELLRVGATIHMAQTAQELGESLSMHLLERYAADSATDAYHRCIAWQAFLQDAGYVLQSDADQVHVAAMNDLERAHYDDILGHTDPLDVLLAPGLDLVPDILRRRRGPRREQEHRTIHVQMPATLHASLTKQARAHGCSLPDLLLGCATGATIGPDLSLIAMYRQDVGRCLALLQGIASNSALNDDTVQQLLPIMHRITAGLHDTTQLLTELSRHT